jgi:uncharacterized protein (TIRG00374 family)
MNGVTSEGRRTGTSQHLKSIILSLIALGLIAAFVYYLYVNSDKYLGLLRLSTQAVIFLFVSSLISTVINGLINTYLFQSLGVNLSHLDGFYLAAASSLANQLPISGGIITRGYYLKQKHNLSYTKYFSATLALFFCFIAVNGLIGTAILLYWVLVKKIVVSSLLLTGFAIMAACLLVFWLPLDNIKILNRLHKWVRQASEGWMLISRNPVLLVKLVGLQTSFMLLLAIRYWLAFHMLSQNVSVGVVILFSSASVLTQIVSIAPGGLGVREGLVGGVAAALGFDVGISVVAVGLDRLVATSTILLIGGISTIILGKQISETSITHGKQIP